MLNFLNLLSARNWQNSSKLVFDRKYRKNFCHAKISCCWQCQKNAIVSPSSSLVLHRQSDHIINTDTHTWVENTFGKTRMMTEVPWSIFMVQNIEVWQFDQLVVCMQQYQLKCYDRFFLSTCLSDQFLLSDDFCHWSIFIDCFLLLTIFFISIRLLTSNWTCINSLFWVQTASTNEVKARQSEVKKIWLKKMESKGAAEHNLHFAIVRK